MIKRISRWFHSPEKLGTELRALQSCDIDSLPLLVIEDMKAYIDKPKGTARPNIDYVLSAYDSLIPHYKNEIILSTCNIADIYLREPDRYDRVLDKTVVRGIQFWHDDGNQYIYWSWMHADKRLKYFSRDLFDAMARQGLDRRTVDNFRIDYRAGRIYQHKLPL